MLSIIQIITVPFTFLIIFISLKKLIQSYKISEELKKAQYTNDFVLRFKQIYSDLSSVADIKQQYYKNVGLGYVQAYINEQEALKFDKNYYISVLKQHNLSRDKVQALLSTEGKLEHGFIETVEFLCTINVLTNDFWYTDYYENYEILRTKMQAKEIISDAHQTESIQRLNSLFIATLSVKEASLLNDLECLCLNTKFSLIKYDVIYNLIIQLFEYIVRQYYIELMESILIAREERYDVFSNITDVYNELITIKIERLNNVRQKEVELAQLNNDKRDIFVKNK
jgi:hypothetical protein